MTDFINYGKQWIDKDDIASVTAALQSDFLTQGPRVGDFEKALADYVGARYAVAVSNGTAALHIAVQALHPDKKWEGITSPNTFVASSNCFLYNGFKPGFSDIDPKTYNLCPDALKEKITPHTRVVVPVHFAGQPADMERISALAEIHGIHLIEDASHAIGSTYTNGKKVGSCCFSDMTIFSFHPVKTIATGEGGAITTNSKNLYDMLIKLRTHGITKEPSKLLNTEPDFVGPWYYEMHDLGFNYRMTDMQAALGCSQMKKIDTFAARRREIVDTYNAAFKNENWLTTPYERDGLSSAFHLYVLKIDFQTIGKTRTRVMEELKAKGIGTQVHYIPVHLQPYYRNNFGFKPGDFPEAEHYYSQCLSIPLYAKMSDEDVNRVIEAVKDLH
ncbi:MAG: UDP-4-amino-4,6-dideoxy-N-acetyl-beta-L-altrosamine transaminase [bacterium]|nr:UDP-4-amino-4,6-dideoxy-N-acetyl-beta-L-altrosamine transaminase [bacterium]